jgi:pilus assembly protein TadC
MMERRVRTWWVVRERYRRAGWAASVLGGLLALLPILAAVRADGLGALLDPRFLLISLAVVTAGVVVPAWIVSALWRWQKRRNGVNWS